MGVGMKNLLQFPARKKILDLHEEKQLGGWGGFGIVFFKDVMSLSVRTDTSFKNHPNCNTSYKISATYFYMKL